ncbi:DeoR family transcriptional regulator [Sediminihabitans luteus]|nr:DeoR/GlpR family DNA-binding transcription regulator [Sediminihabitans luteus]GIJ00643.1 DeoR family transcriptional regulator [Sediminihabitans luteus]
MLATQRHDRILTALRLHGAVRIAELAESLDVSDMTVRRDITELAERGVLRKVHGGAVLPRTAAHEPGFAAKSAESVPEKVAIARAALAYVEAGAAIALSAGTTTTALASVIAEDPALRPLTVVTNSVSAAEVLHATGDPRLETILTGGVRTPSDALVGPVADRALASLRVDVAFLGAHGVGLAAGLTTPNLDEGATNAMLVAAASRTVVLADHTKWQETGLTRFAALEDVDVLVTDDGLPPDDQAAARDVVDELVVATVDPVAEARA